MESVMKKVMAQPEAASGVKWGELLRNVKERYSGRWDLLEVILDGGAAEEKSNKTEIIDQARNHILLMLAPYLVNVNVTSSIREWLVIPMEHCKSHFTSTIDDDWLSHHEKLIKGSIEVVVQEMCRTLGVMWVDGFDLTEQDEGELLAKWSNEVRKVKEWLAWAEWVRCDPACKPTVRSMNWEPASVDAHHLLGVMQPSSMAIPW